jgi:hypothetical protein
MRPIHGAAVVFAATLAATVGHPGSAEAFFFLPILQQSQPSLNFKSDRSPGDNNRWRRSGGDGGKDEAAKPVKPSPSTRKRDEESNSSGKSGKSHAKSEASSSQASRTRSVRQEPPSKSSGHANASVRRESPAGADTPHATPPAQAGDTSANSAQATSAAQVGSILGDTFDEKLGEVFQARIDALLKQSN